MRGQPRAMRKGGLANLSSIGGFGAAEDTALLEASFEGRTMDEAVRRLDP